MPIKHAAAKYLRKSRAYAQKNLSIERNIQYLLKKVKKLVDEKKADEAKKFVLQALRAIDRAAQKGVMKKNTAARKKSRLSLRMNKAK